MAPDESRCEACATGDVLMASGAPQRCRQIDAAQSWRCGASIARPRYHVNKNYRREARGAARRKKVKNCNKHGFPGTTLVLPSQIPAIDRENYVNMLAKLE